MKMSRIALAMLVAAPFAAANAGVTVTPLLVGYTWQDTKHNNSYEDHLYGETPELQDDLFVGAALGVELTPWLGFEAEYNQVKGDIEDSEASYGEYKQTQINGNFYVTSDLITKNYDSKIKPYVLLGAGHYKYEYDLDGDARLKDDEGTLGNAGLGAFWRLNDALSLRTEARATYNIDEDFWNYTALAGLNVVLGGHLKPAAPVVEVAPVEPVAPVAPAPQELTEDLNMELRVFFDTNKSNIKDQYKPEIAKVAEKLVEYPNATARIEGHTDNTGPRALNERLSLARANSVKSSLVNEYNVDASRLSTQGFAWDQPIADNNTKEGRAMNRRVFATISGSRTVLAEQPAAQ
ncbi:MULTISPECIES: outer membrane protein Omp38 [Acinetobacter]|jgi:OmpA-OmpF porin, OOP family|uniref:Outer membrane protein omp38 n=2 Tax=Acinetobacter schindleri TaxID=108981 RepID=N9AG91_9GAMM|nr:MULTISPECIES: OmpA family protein [Acinetobacter]ENV13366.1 outer membrane protein omp38 [Acinetobacter schindleri NIPH 900]ENV45099.1 outer membrane protein omp38 [Acinetobacter schindleri CIP 107287]ENW99719.1 outer membrane protein omp38 [Acinetobacter sp. CIP 101934]MCU4324243.1 OmpA family protein [Acinetobacter schindleri]MCU4520795.1 OmpA family protein [Acinetobacter schindleri]